MPRLPSMPCSPTAVADNPAKLKILESGLDIRVLLDTWIPSSPVAGGCQREVNKRQTGKVFWDPAVGNLRRDKGPKISSYLLSSLSKQFLGTRDTRAGEAEKQRKIRNTNGQKSEKRGGKRGEGEGRAHSIFIFHQEVAPAGFPKGGRE